MKRVGVWGITITPIVWYIKLISQNSKCFSQQYIRKNSAELNEPDKFLFSNNNMHVVTLVYYYSVSIYYGAPDY